jgi:hypothetical protein
VTVSLILRKLAAYLRQPGQGVTGITVGWSDPCSLSNSFAIQRCGVVSGFTIDRTTRTFQVPMRQDHTRRVAANKASVVQAASIIRCRALIDPEDFRVALKRATKARERSLHRRFKFAVRRRYVARKRGDDD